jgi:hypothetical protein
MGELARRRQARDLWISRGHLGAAAAAVGIGLLLAFLVGTAVGRRGVGLDREAPYAEVPEEALVDLLARVETSAVTGGGAARLTYPEALAGRATEVALPVDPPAPGEVRVEAPPFAEIPGLGAPPTAGVGVRLARSLERAAVIPHLEAAVSEGLPVWARVERSGGVDVFEVGVGPWDDARSGAAALDAAATQLVPLEREWIRFAAP